MVGKRTEGSKMTEKRVINDDVLTCHVDKRNGGGVITGFVSKKRQMIVYLRKRTGELKKTLYVWKRTNIVLKGYE